MVTCPACGEEIHLSAGDDKRARPLFDEAMERFRQKGATAFVARLKDRMASVERRTADSI